MGSKRGCRVLPSVQAQFDGFLFDMDGTIIDSTAAVVKHWHAIGNEIGVAPETILATSHGRRSIDVLKLLAPEKATWDYVKEMEAALPRLYGRDALEVPGARTLLDTLTAQAIPWAIVTSGTQGLVSGWLDVLSLAHPQHLVTAESVRQGKPDPACYLLGRARLGMAEASKDILVLEDSPAGIQSGKAAGCKVLGLVTSHTFEQIASAEPHWVVRDLTCLRVMARDEGKVKIELSNVLLQLDL